MSLKLPLAAEGRHPSDELCKYLRAKVSTAPHGDRRALWALRTEASTVYWCLLTMGPAGPDDGLVHAERCGAGRVCRTLPDDVLV
jgi:hypothetical protein